MIREARGFGSDITEAQENARIQLGAGPEDDVQFEIITQNKKKILGLFGGCKAEVRAYIELPDEKPAREKKAPKNNKKPVQPKPQKSVSKPAKQEKEMKPAKAESSVDYSKAVDADALPADSKPAKAVKYLEKIFVGLGCSDLSVKVIEKENSAIIIFEGEGVGAVIGRRGETLDSLQYLASLAANNGGGYYKVSLDVGNYRERRESTLASLAMRVSQQVIKSGRSRALEPMNPYERRIIHTAVQGIDGVVSNSVGSGPSRRVVISPEGSETNPSYAKPYGDRRRDGRGKVRHGADRRPSNTVATAPTREPKKDSDIPLYGKIN